MAARAARSDAAYFGGSAPSERDYHPDAPVRYRGPPPAIEAEGEEHDDGVVFGEDEDAVATDGSLLLRRDRRSAGGAAPAAELPAVESLRIVARVRPLLREARVAVEQVGPAELQVRAIEKNKLKRGLRKGDPPIVTTYESTQRFGFDSLFWLDRCTADVYEAEVAPLIEAVLGGANACLLAYGQTGSGKTFTLTGDPKKRAAAGAAWGAGIDAGGTSPYAGLMQMASEALMARIDEINEGSAGSAGSAGPMQSLHVFVTAGEIYQEKLMDLGSIGPGGVKAKKLTGATLKRIPIASGSAEELIDTLEALIDRRASGATNKNDHSSRSHAVYAVHVAQRRLVSAAEASRLLEDVPHVTFMPVARGPGAAAATAAAVAAGLGRDAGWVSLPVGSLGLVDLAGAEYASATEGREDTRRLEGGKNNLGLMSLKAAFKHVGDVAAGRTREPFSWYRSTLTRILKPFFVSPHSRLVMLVTASPEWGDAAQTAQALAEGVIIAGRPLEEKHVVELGPTADDRAGGFGRVPAGGAAGGAGSGGRSGGKPILRAGGGTGGGKRTSAVAPPPAPSPAASLGPAAAPPLPSGRSSLPASASGRSDPAALRSASGSRSSALAAAAPVYDDDPFRPVSGSAAAAAAAAAAAFGGRGGHGASASPVVARSRSARATAPPAPLARAASAGGTLPHHAHYDDDGYDYSGVAAAGPSRGWEDLVAGARPGSSAWTRPVAAGGAGSGSSAGSLDAGSGAALSSGRSYGSSSSAPAAAQSASGTAKGVVAVMPASSRGGQLPMRDSLSGPAASLDHRSTAWNGNGSAGVADCWSGAGAASTSGLADVAPPRAGSASARSAATQAAAAARLAGGGSRRSVADRDSAEISSGSYAAAHRESIAGKPTRHRDPLAGRPWE